MCWRISSVRGITKVLAYTLAAGVALTACAGEMTANERARSIQIEDDTVWAPPGSPTTVRAIAKDSVGNVVTDVAVVWGTSNPAIATVAPSAQSFALVSGLILGSATKLTATLPSGASTSATVVAAPAGAVYDVTTTLTTYTSEGGTCPQFVMYCDTTVPRTGATLSGTLTTSFNDVSGAFVACDPDYSCCETCIRTYAYVYNGGTKPHGLPTWDFSVIANNYGPMVSLKGSATPDSAWGTVTFQEVRDARSPPRYGGTFVARRRK